MINELKADPATAPEFERSRDRLSVVLVGNERIIRSALSLLLEDNGIDVRHSFANESELAGSLDDDNPPDAIVLITGDGPFTSFQLVSDAMSQTRQTAALVVLARRVTHGQVHAALRIGAKAYVATDAEPQELIKAIQMVADNKVYLSPEAAEVLVSEVSAGPGGGHRGRGGGSELSRREIEIVQLLCEGLSGREIAHRLHISAKTVENHRYNIYRKCGVDSIAGLIRHAVQHGLVTL